MEDLGCPRCKTTKSRAPSLKLLVNVCGHTLCSSCVELLFIKGSASCPECGVVLRRSSFRVQLFEDAGVEKEIEIRKRILKDFNKRETDFASLRDYNDYLEDIETIIFNLVNNIDVMETNTRIAHYKTQNKEQIEKGRSKPREELLELEAILDEEKIKHEQTTKMSEAIAKEEKIRKLKNKEALIDDLMFLEDVDASDVLAKHKKNKENDADIREAAFKNINASQVEDTSQLAGTGSRFNVPGRPTYVPTAGTAKFLPIPKKEEVPLYSYKPDIQEFDGPPVPSLEDLSGVSNKYLAFIRTATVPERAGGFHSKIACRKALMDAFSDIAFMPSISGIKQNPFETRNFADL